MKTALLVIDYQKAFDDLGYWGERNNSDAESNAVRVLAAFRRAGLPVIHVRHDSTTLTSPLRPGHPGNGFKTGLEPAVGEPIIGKNVNSAFIGTDLEARLRAAGIGRLVIMGISTDHCVSTTTRMAANLGFEAVLVGDACYTFDRRDGEGVIPAAIVHRVELAILGAEFATITTTAAVMADLETLAA